jgi:hypothetical protein
MRSQGTTEGRLPAGRLLLRSFVLAVIVASGGTASAGGPVREFTGLVPGDNFDFEGVCEDFTVNLLIVENNEYTITFAPNAAGTTRQLVEGRFVVAFTNLASGSSVTRNVSGPGEYLYHADGSVDFRGSGAWAIFFFPEQRGPGTPGALFVNYGQIVLHTDPFGIQTVVSQVGTQEDLCATLGP